MFAELRGLVCWNETHKTFLFTRTDTFYCTVIICYDTIYFASRKVFYGRFNLFQCYYVSIAYLWFHGMSGKVTPHYSRLVVWRIVYIIVRQLRLVIGNKLKTTYEIYIIIRSTFIFLVDTGEWFWS